MSTYPTKSAATETFFYNDATDSEHNATIHSGKYGTMLDRVVRPERKQLNLVFERK